MATLPAVHALDEAPGLVASVERIDAWMAIAGKGDRFVYASRLCLPPKSAGAARMRALSDRGLVLLTRPRSTIDTTIFNYTATRTGVCTPLTRPARAVLTIGTAPVMAAEAAVIDALLPIVTRFAEAGRVCPTDRQLAERAGLTDAAVREGLTAMVAARLIRVEAAPAPTNRRILILASGAITGLMKR